MRLKITLFAKALILLFALTSAIVNAHLPSRAYNYDDLSRRTSATNANGTASTMGYDPTVGALSSVALTFGSTASNVGFTMGRNRVQQVTNSAIDNSLYQWTNHYYVNRPFLANPLDQYTIEPPPVPGPLGWPLGTPAANDRF